MYMIVAIIAIVVSGQPVGEAPFHHRNTFMSSAECAEYLTSAKFMSERQGLADRLTAQLHEAMGNEAAIAITASCEQDNRV